MSLFDELKRRNVFRVAAAYIVSAWLLIQVAETIFPLFGLGDAPARIVVILLLIGFLPTLVVAWIFELTPVGLQKDEDVERSQASTAASARRFDRIVMLVLVLAVSYFAIDKFLLSESRERAIADAARQFGMSEALAAYTSNESIAVLPFVDMSPNQDQEYFADGVTEQLLNELAQLEGLNVAGRTSSFAFKGHNQDLRSIGEQLGVANILEGSIRKDGNNLLVTAQLINSQSGFHLWSDTYEQELNDIFDVQEEIARAVAGALSVALDIDGRDALPGTGTDSIEAYEAFLEARASSRANPPEVTIEHYKRATEIDPEYAEAWARLGGVYGAQLSWYLPPEEARAAQEQGRQYVVHATEIDPDLAMAYGMLSGYAWARKNWIGATEYHQKYSELAPADIVARLGSANVLGRTGRLREATRIDEFRLLGDPLHVNVYLIQAEHYIQSQRYEDAVAALANADRVAGFPTQGAALRHLFMAIAQGQSESIKKALENYIGYDQRVTTIVNAVLETLDSDADVSLREMRRLYETDDSLTGEGRVIIASLAAHFGDAKFALDVMSDELSINMLRSGRLWYPFFSDMRSLPGFKTLAEDIGFVAYWRKYGWADTCRPLGEDDFECN